MSRIILKPLKSKKQLRRISFKKVISAGFVDESEQFFTVSFDVGDGTKQDLTVIFETRTPHVLLSEPYKGGE